MLAEQLLGAQDGVVVVEDGVAQVALVERRVHLRHLGVALDHGALRGVGSGRQPRRRPVRERLRRHQLLLGLADDVEDGVNEVMRAQRVPQEAWHQLVEH